MTVEALHHAAIHHPRRLYLPFINLKLLSGPLELEKHEAQQLITSSPVSATTPPSPVRNPPPPVAPLLPYTTTVTT
jgi:hypothetical protein